MIDCLKLEQLLGKDFRSEESKKILSLIFGPHTDMSEFQEFYTRGYLESRIYFISKGNVIVELFIGGTEETDLLPKCELLDNIVYGDSMESVKERYDKPLNTKKYESTIDKYDFAGNPIRVPRTDLIYEFRDCYYTFTFDEEDKLKVVTMSIPY